MQRNFLFSVDHNHILSCHDHHGADPSQGKQPLDALHCSCRPAYHGLQAIPSCALHCLRNPWVYKILALVFGTRKPWPTLIKSSWLRKPLPNSMSHFYELRNLTHFHYSKFWQLLAIGFWTNIQSVLRRYGSELKNLCKRKDVLKIMLSASNSWVALLQCRMATWW